MQVCREVFYQTLFMTTDYAMLARPSADLSWGLLAPGEASPRCFSWFYCWRIGNVDSGIVSALQDGTANALRTLSDFNKKG